MEILNNIDFNSIEFDGIVEYTGTNTQPKGITRNH